MWWILAVPFQHLFFFFGFEDLFWFFFNSFKLWDLSLNTATFYRPVYFKISVGRQNCSFGKGTCCQAWLREFNPKTYAVEEKNLTSGSCPLTSAHDTALPLWINNVINHSLLFFTLPSYCPLVLLERLEAVRVQTSLSTQRTPVLNPECHRTAKL